MQPWQRASGQLGHFANLLSRYTRLIARRHRDGGLKLRRDQPHASAAVAKGQLEALSVLGFQAKPELIAGNQ